MVFKLQRPILVGGLGLTAAGWAVDSLYSNTLHLGSSIVWGAIAIGSGCWWLSQRSRPLSLQGAAPTIDRSTTEALFASIEALITQLDAELDATADKSAIARWRTQLAQLPTELERSQIRLAAMGGKSVGKTTLAQQLVAKLSGTAALSAAPDTASADSAFTDSATPDTLTSLAPSETDGQRSDLVVFVTAGDLTDSEFQTIQQLLARQQRVVLAFNKQDQYSASDRPVILQQIRDRLKDALPMDDVVAIATHPAPIKVRQHLADGSVQERMEQPAPDLSALVERVQHILSTQGRQLIVNTTYRQALALRTEVQTGLNRLRRDRALPLIEHAQWIAAAAAFANPVPSLDLVATAAINAQLVVDLGAIYQQSFSIEQGKVVAGNLAGQMVKLGLVEITSQAIAPLLKSHAITYVAGGAMQGISAAYLTRIAGLCLVEYFEERSLNPSASAPFQLDRLIQSLKAVFQANQRTAFLQTLVKQGLSRLVPDANANANANALSAALPAALP